MFKVYQNKENDFVTDAYRVCTIRSESFDEIMPIVQVHVGKHELQDALFDR
jgi:hypothetical protein